MCKYINAYHFIKLIEELDPENRKIIFNMQSDGKPRIGCFFSNVIVDNGSPD